jgi:hypothetical protein
MDFAFGAERTVAACPGMKHRALFAPILRAYGVSIQAWRSPRQLTACKGRQARQHAIQAAMLVFVFRAWGVWGLLVLHTDPDWGLVSWMVWICASHRPSTACSALQTYTYHLYLATYAQYTCSASCLGGGGCPAQIWSRCLCLGKTFARLQCLARFDASAAAGVACLCYSLGRRGRRRAMQWIAWRACELGYGLG